MLIGPPPTLFIVDDSLGPGDEASSVWAARLHAVQHVLCTFRSFFCFSQRHLQEMGSYESTVALHSQESILPLSTVQSVVSVSSSKVCVVRMRVRVCVRVCVCVCVIYVRMGL